MSDHFRRSGVVFVAIAAVAFSCAAQAQSEPPGRVGRLAFTQGTVSFHDPQQDGWTPAMVNTPLTSGDAIWTEPNAHSEVSLGGTRIRMEGATQLDMLAVDDSQTRLQLDQGRIDVRSFAMDTQQPYQVLTPRGTASLTDQGDYYIESGSSQDPTRLGVRSGAAEFQAMNGQTVPVHPGEVAELTGDPDNPQIRIVNTAPPPPPGYWAVRDRQVVYDQPPQYLTASVTGYEDLNAYGAWTNDPTYGEVWYPRAVPAGWEPYRTGRWVYQPPWGWTWVDDQPWGFAPYHYGRWAHVGSRWAWVPPEREQRPMYAPALVAFVGGVELAAVLGNRAASPVGWFPLGPREAYVPPYSADRDYYLRVNRGARVQDEILSERWQRAERREAAPERNAPFMNQRFATVMPAAAFVRSQPVTRAALQVAPDRIAAAPVAPIAAPPAPTASLASAKQPTDPRALAPTPNLPVAKTALAEMPALARPTQLEKPAMPPAPGPKLAATQPTAPTAETSKHALPPLAPRQGLPPPVLHGNVTPVTPQPARPGEPAHPQTATPPAEHAAPVEPTKPATQPPPHVAQPVPPEHAGPQPTTPPVQHAPPQQVQAPQPQHVTPPAQPPHPAEHQGAAPQPQHANPPPQPAPHPPQQGEAPPPQPQPQHVQAPPPQPQPQHVQTPPPQPQPQHVQAPPPPPQPQHVQAPPPPPQPQHVQAPQQAQAPAPQQSHPAPQPPQQHQNQNNEKK
ncbi:MAG: hypothetical protein JO339_20790 [Alphaproteobacteria bacterium]|nr:hypothetical protein [Alphaproteobacteria bacterium]